MKIVFITLILVAPVLQGASQYVAAGIVVDSQTHRPLGNARVSIAATTLRTAKIEQITKQDGRFSFVVSEVGKYTLQVTKVGYPQQAYRRSSFSSLSSAIVVRGDQDTSHIVFEANRGGAITGLIKDEDSEPVGHALVAVFQSLVVGGERKVIVRGQVRANASGEFRVAALPAGNYYVCVMGRPWFADSLLQLQQIEEELKNLPRKRHVIQLETKDQDAPQTDEPADTGPEPPPVEPPYSPDPNFRGTAFVPSFYPRAQTIEEASLVHLDIGGETQVPITLPYGKAVSIKGSITSSSQMSVGNAHLYKKYQSQYILFQDAAVSTGGKFQFPNIPAGSYELFAYSDAASGSSSWNVRQTIEVGSSDLDLALRADYLGAISGRVLFESERPASGGMPLLLLRNEEDTTLRIQPGFDGNFSLSRLPMGRYEMSSGSSEYVAAYLSDPAGQRLPLTLEINSSEPIHRDIVLSRAVSVIEGTVNKAGTPQVGSFVLLMPQDPSQRWAYRVDQTDSDGSFRLSKIPSGDYTLISLSEGAEVAYRDTKVAAVLAQAGKAVHIVAGDHLNMKLEVLNTDTLRLPQASN